MLANNPNEDSDEKIHIKYNEICENLTIDKNDAESAWENYKKVRNDHNLDGDQIHWLCSALYATLTQQSNSMSGVSLTKLLRLCNIKLYEFLKKTERFFHMVATTKDCISRFKEFGKALSVSILAYEKYSSLFNDVFTSPNYSDLAALASVSISTPQKGKKGKAMSKCTSNDVYEFCWYLFISINGEDTSNTKDLVTSYHMLLCCVDTVYSNIVADKREDLLNMSFTPTTNLLAGRLNDKKSAEPISIITELCKDQNASEVDALAIKSHAWKNRMKNYINQNVLKGNATTFLGLLSAQNYEHNINALKKRYEAYVISVGKIDEGIFLLQPPSEASPNQSFHSQLIKTMVPETPLTRRNCLPGRDSLLASPVSNATQNVNKLRSQLDGVSLEPTPALRDLCKTSEVDPFPSIEQHIQTMREMFVTEFRAEAGNERFDMAVKLFYRLLENIIRKEKLRPNFEQKMASMIPFISKLLLATSVEIVIYAYGASAKFPWILGCFGIDAFNFYKLIEIIVTNHEGILNRELIKHLNAIEEQCLESLAWKRNSPLWNDIAEWQRRNAPLPKQEDNLSSSIGLFFRKFYKLAFIRIEKLINDLNESNEKLQKVCNRFDILQKIWTIFENSIVKHIDLMQDRHLDQLLMCSIYIFARVRNLPIQFKDIMTEYRTQPQAESHVYREVLGTENNRCDIIDFYNRIYVQAIQEFVLRLRNATNDDVSLSPLPMNVRLQPSPRKLSKNHSIYIHELHSNETLQSPNPVSYTFNSSPVEEFSKIKKIISASPNTNGKRTLPLNELDDQQNDNETIANRLLVPFTTKKLRTLISDRQENSDK